MGRTFVIGQRVWWRDPSRDEPCDGWGRITRVPEAIAGVVDEYDILVLDMEDGGEAEVWAAELHDEEQP